MKFNHASKQLGVTAANWSLVLVHLCMCGIPCALGWSAYLSVWREVGALRFERLAVFVPSLPPLCFPLYISVTGACLLVGVGARGWIVRFYRCCLHRGAGCQ